MNAITEEEARKKWCPMARTQYGNRYRDDGLSELHFCIASDCMMWRWTSARNIETRRLPLRVTEIDGVPVVRAGSLRVIGGESWRYRYTDVDADGEFELLERSSKDETKRGYCGLSRSEPL